MRGKVLSYKSVGTNIVRNKGSRIHDARCMMHDRKIMNLVSCIMHHEMS